MIMDDWKSINKHRKGATNLIVYLESSNGNTIAEWMMKQKRDKIKRLGIHLHKTNDYGSP